MPDAPTNIQMRALEHLALHQQSSPIDLGRACGAFRWACVTPDAFTGIGERMGRRLAEMGLASSSLGSDGCAGYAITAAGLEVVRQVGVMPIKGPHAAGGRNAS